MMNARRLAVVVPVLTALSVSISQAVALAQDEPPMPMAFAGMTLQQAEDAGVSTSPEVAAARARSDGARAALAIAEWGVLPTGFVSFTESPQSAAPLTPTVSAHQTEVGVQANLNDLLFGATPQISQASASARAAAADEAAAERAERIAVARAYFDALKRAAVLAARDDALRLARSELNAAQIRYKAGDVPKVDVVRADVAVARAEADDENARADAANARDTLLAETGLAQTSVASTVAGAPPSVPPLALDPAAAASAALQLRPEVREAQEQVDASASAFHASQIALLPPVTVAAGRSTGVDSAQRVAGSAVSAQMTVPLPFGPGERIAQAKAALDEANAHLASVRRTVMLETSASARSLVAADRAAAATLRGRNAARQALDAEELGYRAGAASGLEVAEARSTYAQAEIDLLSAEYDEAAAVAVFEIEAGL
jgi:outer membrane protein TolC